MKKVVFFIIALCFNISVYSQVSTKEIKANKYFERFSYSQAIERYEAIKDLSINGKRNLAVSYYNVNNFPKSKEVFEQFINTPDANAEDVFMYASVLRINGNYDESLIWLDKFKNLKPNDNRSKIYSKTITDLPKLHKDEGRYKIVSLNINTAEQDFGPAYYLNKIVFASSKEGVKSVKRSYNWNNKPFLNIYEADRTSDEQLKSPKQFRKDLNKIMHEGPASFNAEGTYMAFNRNNYKEKSSDGAIKLEIFFSTKNEKGEWQKEEPFKLNNKEYNVGHPFLSANGNTMYFSSDMPGGFGGADIYKIEKNANGEWGDAINLGDAINTESDEMFPFFQEELGILFFASKGHIGLGGLDIYLSPLSNGKFSKVYNAGFPLNTQYDDFALIIDAKMQKGYFSSNRTGGAGDDDIYAFELLKPFVFGKILKGIAKDQEGTLLANTKIELWDENGNIIQTIETNENANYEFTVEADKEYKLKGSKSDYFDALNSANTKTNDDIIYSDLILEKDPGLSLYAVVTDKKTGYAIKDVKMTIIDNMTCEKINYITPESGDYLRPLKDKKLNDRGSYNFILEKDGYFTKTVTYNELFDKPGKYLVHTKLDFTMDALVKDLSEMIQINPINFDLNKFNIRPDAAKELDKIVEVMNKYPDMVIELGSHTDCRASIAYNMSLSDKRAKASAAYIKARISKPERIYGKGYGESRLLNDCACEGNLKSDCSEEEHAKNRRTEFRVISTGNDKIKVDNKSTNSFDKK
jgi:outer membrane protein OmpA-like peptidoglycan-associated protein